MLSASKEKNLPLQNSNDKNEESKNKNKSWLQSNVGESSVTDHDVTSSTSASKGDSELSLDGQDNEKELRECTHKNMKRNDDNKEKRKINLTKMLKMDVVNDSPTAEDDDTVDVKTFEDWRSTREKSCSENFKFEGVKKEVAVNSHYNKDESTSSGSTTSKTFEKSNDESHSRDSIATSIGKIITPETAVDTDKVNIEKNDTFSNDPLIDVEQEVQEICGVTRNNSSKASDRVKLRGKVGEVSISLSLDTLADVSLLTEDQWIKIGRPILDVTDIRLRGAFFSNSRPLGKCFVEISLGSRTIEAHFLVVKQLCHPCIMGRDLLEKLEAKVSLSQHQNTVTIPKVGVFDLKSSKCGNRDTLKINPVVLENDIVIKANSETLLQVKVIEAEGKTGMISPCDHLPTGIMVAQSICSINENM